MNGRQRRTVLAAAKMRFEAACARAEAAYDSEWKVCEKRMGRARDALFAVIDAARTEYEATTATARQQTGEGKTDG